MVEPANCRTFPEGTVFKNREGRVVSINEDNFRLKRIIGEGSGEMQNVRAAVFEAEHVNAGNKLVVLKMHYDLYPFHAHLSRERYQEAFEDEAEVIQAISGSGHSPQYITHGHIMQTADDPYPDDGEIRILAMSRMEGVRYPLMREAGLVLLPADLKIIMQQTVETLEYMRQQGWQKDIEPDDVFYNPDTKHMFIIKLSNADPSTNDTPVTEESDQLSLVRSLLQDDAEMMMQYPDAYGLDVRIEQEYLEEE